MCPKAQSRPLLSVQHLLKLLPEARQLPPLSHLQLQKQALSCRPLKMTLLQRSYSKLVSSRSWPAIKSEESSSASLMLARRLCSAVSDKVSYYLAKPREDQNPVCRNRLSPDSCCCIFPVIVIVALAELIIPRTGLVT